MISAPAWPWALLAATAAAAAVLLAMPVRPSGVLGSMAVRPPTRRQHLVALLVAVGAAALVLPQGGTTSALLVLGVAAALGARHLWTRRHGAQAAQETSERVREACEVMAAELATGLPVASALAAAQSVWSPLSSVVTCHRLGGSVSSELRALAQAPGAGDLVLVAAAWQVAERTGAGLSATLVDVAAHLRDQQRSRRVVRAELASARSTARLLAALPLLTLVMASGLGGEPVQFLLATGPGLACLALGLLLTWSGLAWIEAIAAGVEGAT